MVEEDTSQKSTEEPQAGGEPLEEGAEAPSEEAEQPSEEPTEAGDVEQPRTYTQEEWSKRESEKDKQFATVSKQIQGLEAKVAQATAMRQSDSEYGQIMQNLAMQESAEVRKLEEQGQDSTPLKQAYSERRQTLGMAYQLYQTEQAQKQTQRSVNARDLVWKHGLTEADMPAILSVSDDAMAHVAEKMQLERKLNAQQVAQASGKKAPQDFTAPTGAASGGSTVNNIRDAFNEGRINSTEYEKQMRAKGMEP